MIMSLYGFAEISGIFLIERLIQKVSDRNGLIASFIMVLLPQLIIKCFAVSETTMYVFFLIMIFSIGAVFNLIIILQERRIDPKYSSISFEMNYAIGQFTNMFTPIISKMDEPWPTIAMCSFCILGLIAIISMPNPCK